MHAAGEIVEELSANGEWVAGEGVGDSSQARSKCVRDGVVTDGPFLEAKEALAGYCMIDVAIPKRAEEIAERSPDAKQWSMEVRPLIHGGGGEG